MAREVAEADFETAVLGRSFEVPVVVDFWAEWCAPCRSLGPIIERVAASYAGRMDLVKVDTDANPAVAAEWGIRGIPAVKAIRDGEVIAEFVGAQPETTVRAFFEGVLADEDRRAERARALVAARAAIDAARPDEARRLLASLEPDSEASKLLAEIDLAEAGIALDDAEPTLASLLAQVAGGDRKAARARMVEIFEVLGPDHPLTRRYRAELAKALF